MIFPNTKTIFLFTFRQYMLDAIAYCGTPSCVSVVKDVTINGEVSGERANAFLMSIAFVAKTTNGMIRDILDIAQQQPSRQVFLTLGTLISRHCAKSPEACVSIHCFFRINPHRGVTM